MRYIGHNMWLNVNEEALKAPQFSFEQPVLIAQRGKNAVLLLRAA